MLAEAVPEPQRAANTVWNIKLADGRVVSKILGAERPTLQNGGLREGQAVSSGPYADLKTAITRERSDLWYVHLLRTAMHQGIVRKSGQHHRPTLDELAEWTGFSVHVFRAWLKPNTSRSHRPMPRYAIRLVLHEMALHDENGVYDWAVLLKKCR